jgi:hypothetical protein
VVSGSDVPLDGKSCPAYKGLWVTPPGGSEASTVGTYLDALAADMPACGGLRVSAVHPMADFTFQTCT